MAEETIVDKAGFAVGMGLEAASDAAGAIKTAIDSAVTAVTGAFKKAPTNQAVKTRVKEATQKADAKKAPAKKAVKKTAGKKAPTKKTANKTAAKKAPAKKSAAKKSPVRKAAKKMVKAVQAKKTTKKSAKKPAKKASWRR